MQQKMRAEWVRERPLKIEEVDVLGVLDRCISRGGGIVPERYRVRYARDAEEALTELGKFVNYVRTGPVYNLLPSELHDISARNAREVAEWQERIESVRRDTAPTGPTSRSWLHFLDEVFKGARQRLDELVRARCDGR